MGRIKSETNELRLTTAEVAARLGVKPSTVSGYLSRRLMPEPDGKLGRTVWWWESTIDDWHEQRPGLGWRKGLAEAAGADDE